MGSLPGGGGFFVLDWHEWVGVGVEVGNFSWPLGKQGLNQMSIGKFGKDFEIIRFNY